jgi:tetratricopeptide (TPR) repeat protein
MGGNLRKLLIATAIIVCASPAAYTADLPTACGSISAHTEPERSLRSCNSALTAQGLTPEQRAEFLFRRGESNYWSYNYNEALQDLDQALELRPEHVPALIRRAWLFVQLGRYDKAYRDAVQALAKSGNDTDANFVMAFVLIHSGDSSAKHAAEAGLLRIVESDPDHYLSKLNLANLYMDDFGKPELALQYLNQILAQPPDKVNSVPFKKQQAQYRVYGLYGRVRFTKADFLIRMNRIEEALKELDKLIQDEPDVPEGYELRYRVVYGGSDFDGMKSDLDQVERLNPKSPELVWGRYNLYQETGKIDLAEKILDDAIDNSASSRVRAWASYKRAQVKKTRKNLDGALADLEESINLDPRWLAQVVTQTQALGYYELESAEDLNAELRNALQACLIDPECAL